MSVTLESVKATLIETEQAVRAAGDALRSAVETQYVANKAAKAASEKYRDALRLRSNAVVAFHAFILEEAGIDPVLDMQMMSKAELDLLRDIHQKYGAVEP